MKSPTHSILVGLSLRLCLNTKHVPLGTASKEFGERISFVPGWEISSYPPNWPNYPAMKFWKMDRYGVNCYSFCTVNLRMRTNKSSRPYIDVIVLTSSWTA